MGDKPVETPTVTRNDKLGDSSVKHLTKKFVMTSDPVEMPKETSNNALIMELLVW